jgi:hypothetical protein
MLLCRKLEDVVINVITSLSSAEHRDGSDLQFDCIQKTACLTERHNNRRQTLSGGIALGTFGRVATLQLMPRCIENGVKQLHVLRLEATTTNDLPDSHGRDLTEALQR